MGTASILGDTYDTGIMPDGREWILSNLRYTGIGYMAPYRDDATIPVYGTMHKHASILAVDFPDGWRIPRESDWDDLIAECGGGTIAGGALKAIGTTVWASPNAGASDIYGWAGVGAGYDDDLNSTWAGFRGYGIYWTSDIIGDGTRRQAVQTAEAGTFTVETIIASSVSRQWRSVRLVRDAPQMNLHVVHDGTWKQVSEQHQIDGGWIKSSQIFVPSSGAWAQS